MVSIVVVIPGKELLAETVFTETEQAELRVWLGARWSAAPDPCSGGTRVTISFGEISSSDTEFDALCCMINRLNGEYPNARWGWRGGPGHSILPVFPQGSVFRLALWLAQKKHLADLVEWTKPRC